MISSILFSFLGVMSLGNYHNAIKMNDVVKKATEITPNSNSGYYYYLWKPTTNIPLRIGYDSRDFMTKECIIEAPCVELIKKKYQRVIYKPITKQLRITNDNSNLYSTTNLLSLLHEKYSMEVNRVITDDSNFIVYRGVPVTSSVYTIVGYYNGYEFKRNDSLVIMKDMTIEDIIDQSDREVLMATMLCGGTLITGVLCGLYEYYSKKN